MTIDLSLVKLAMGNRTLSAIGYLPFFFPLPLFLAKEDEFAQFHGKQSLVLLLALITTWFLIWLSGLIFGGILGHIFIVGIFFKVVNWLIKNIIGNLASIGYIILVIIGMVNAGQGKYWEIPGISLIVRKIRI